ncbi:MAG TPA: ABC transporter permease [Chryseosolibacter sp.]|nr:ABC transporter permease [Chryseosolibacter sp.]
MLRNYLKTSLRAVMKNPLNSFINIFGLATAIGICILSYAFARWAYSTDQFHEYKDQVFLVTFFASRDGVPQQYGMSPRPLGELMKQDFAQVQKVCRVEDRNAVIKYEDRVFHERVRYADGEFLEMLTFPMKWGSANSLHEASSIILSEEMSKKYFGDVNPVGRDLLLKFDETHARSYKVTGVAQKFPLSHTITFNFLINFENLRNDHAYDFQDWDAFVGATFIQVNHPADVRNLEPGMEKYKKLQNAAADDDWAIGSFAFEPLATLHQRSGAIKDDISRSTDNLYESVIFLGIICAFMLALACFNYINIAIVTATKRLKEIGVRKTIGATRLVVIVQFLTENTVITFFALIVGMLLGTFVFIPWLENINHFSMGFTMWDKNLWIYLPAILFLTGVASGIYPSLYVSRFEVVSILKGSMKFGTKNPLTQVFLAVQIVLASVLVTAGVMFTLNTNYMAKRSWGYSPSQALFIAVPDYAAFEKMNAAITRLPEVVSVSGSKHHLGKSHTRTVLHAPDRQFEVDELSVDPQYFETMGLRLANGRVFRDQYKSDERKLVVNETFVSSIGGENPVGKIYKIDSVAYEVVGVVRDFHSYSFFRKVNPTIFRVAEKESYRYLSVRVRAGSEKKNAKALQSAWSQLYPEIPFDGGFQEDVWGNYFEQLEIHANVWRGMASIAMILATLGLYGLVRLNVTARIKEFCIRKVLGAGIASIAGNIASQYLLLFVTGFAIGAPVSHYLMKVFFDRIYTYHIPVTYFGVSVSIAILILVLLATVSTQIRKVAKANPVDGLKFE